MYLAGTVFSKEIPSCYKLPISLIEDGKIYAVEDDVLTKLEVTTVFKTFENVLVQGLDDGTEILTDQISDAYVGMRVNPSSNR